MRILLVERRSICSECKSDIIYYQVSKIETTKGFGTPDEYEVPSVLYSPKKDTYSYFITNLDKIVSHLFDKIVFRQKRNFGLHKHDISGIYDKLLPYIIKLSDIENDTIIDVSVIRCQICGTYNFSDESWRDPIIGKKIIDAKLVTHNKIKSLKDIKDPELREIFKDFDFKHWTNTEKNDKKNQEEWKKLHGVK